MRFQPQDQSYNAAGPFHAMRALTLLGQHYAFGEPVDVSQIDPRLKRQLFDQRFIGIPEAESLKAAAAAPVKKAEAPADPADPAEGGTEKKAAVGPLTAVHKGFGKYSLIDAAGEVVESGLSKEEATKRAGPA